MPRPPLQLLPGVPDPPTPSGRAGFSERGFRREGKGKGPGQDVARGGGLHRAFLALPVKRTFWRFFKGEMALVAWQVAITFDLLMAGRTNAAADTLGLLALYIDQLVPDQGSTALAWLLTLQHDPPQALFSEAVAAPATGGPPFSPLADQKWITSALGYLREMDLIASRKAESKQKPKKPPGLPPPPRRVSQAQQTTRPSRRSS